MGGWCVGGWRADKHEGWTRRLRFGVGDGLWCSHRAGKGPGTPGFGKVGARRLMPQDDGARARRRAWHRYFLIEAPILVPSCFAAPRFGARQSRARAARASKTCRERGRVTCSCLNLNMDDRDGTGRLLATPLRYVAVRARASAADPALKAGQGSGGWPRCRTPQWPPQPRRRR